MLFTGLLWSSKSQLQLDEDKIPEKHQIFVMSYGRKIKKRCKCLLKPNRMDAVGGQLVVLIPQGDEENLL